jgi:pimeloyl-ACP methyl ester carboxylesterase
VERARLFRRACSGVPAARAAWSARPAPVHVPVLLLAGGADPLDPVANLRGWRHRFPDGRLVVVPGAGHGVVGDGCVPALVAQFVARAVARGLDLSCARHVPLPAFTR